MKRGPLLSLLVAAALLPCAASAAEDVLFYRPTEEGFLMDWLVSTRHPFDYAYLGASMNFDALKATGGEAACAPVAGMKAGNGNPWVERHFEPAGWAKGVFEFEPASMFMTYTFAYLYCDQELRDLVLLTGSDDALLVLLNGTQVQKVQMQRGYNTDQDRVAGITLAKGWNRLLCKVDDVMGGHGLVVRFKTKDGQPVTSFRICLSRPPEGVEPRFVDGISYEAEAAKLLKDAVRLSAEEGNLAGAEAACRKVAAQYPRSNAAAEALYQAGSFLVQAKKPDEAFKTFDGLLARYPYAKWAEDALLAKAELLATERKDARAAARTLEELTERFEKSSLVPEAMLKLAALKAAEATPDDSDAILLKVRERFPNTVEAVRALDLLGDNRQRRNDAAKARQLWREAIQEADALSSGKYVWYVNVQAVLKEIADRARAKAEGR